MRRPSSRTILRRITGALIEAQQIARENPESEISKGYVNGLRVAYLYAGGQVDGTEEGWRSIRPEFVRRRRQFDLAHRRVV